MSLYIYTHIIHVCLFVCAPVFLLVFAFCGCLFHLPFVNRSAVLCTDQLRSREVIPWAFRRNVEASIRTVYEDSSEQAARFGPEAFGPTLGVDPEMPEVKAR